MATTNDIDSSDEVVIPSGADTAYFFRNRKIFAEHCKDVSRCVGALHSAKLLDNGWLIRMRIFQLKGSTLPDDILTIAQEAGIGVSIGFMADDYGPPTPEEMKRYSPSGKPISMIYRKWQWIETSITTTPCNVSCQTMNVGTGASDGGKRIALDELVSKGRIAADNAVALGMRPLKKSVQLVVPRKNVELIV